MAANIRQFAALVLIFAATAVTVAADEGVKSSLWVENDSIDIGSVIAGRTASATYVFHNDGPTAVKILRATPT
jgi:hypothetical protein